MVDGGRGFLLVFCHPQRVVAAQRYFLQFIIQLLFIILFHSLGKDKITTKTAAFLFLRYAEIGLRWTRFDTSYAVLHSVRVIMVDGNFRALRIIS